MMPCCDSSEFKILQQSFLTKSMRCESISSDSLCVNVWFTMSRSSWQKTKAYQVLTFILFLYLFWLSLCFQVSSFFLMALMLLSPIYSVLYCVPCCFPDLYHLPPLLYLLIKKHFVTAFTCATLFMRRSLLFLLLH